MSRPSWNQYFMGLAHFASLRSHDSQTKVGCVIANERNQVVSMGYNGFPRGIDDSNLPTTRPEKYPYMVHSEENAISNLTALMGEKLKIFLTHYPCYRCAKLLWQHNIKLWFIEKENLVVSWADEDIKVYNLLVENGLEIVEIETDKNLLVEG